jgi:hypothetical protein
VVVEGLGADQRTLELETPLVSSYGLAGPAFLSTLLGKTYPVQVESVAENGNTVTLEDPLAEVIPFSATATGDLQWATWIADLSTVATTARTNVNWQVHYITGDGEIPDTEIVDSGIVQIVLRPFTTGLSHDKLLGYFPFLSERLPDRQSGFAAQIEAAEAEIVNIVRGEVRALGLTEDAIEGQYFESVHAYLTASLILFSDLSTYGQAEQLRGIFDTQMKATLKRVLVDASLNGVNDTDVSLNDGFNSQTTSSFIKYPSRNPPRNFRIGGPR